MDHDHSNCDALGQRPKWDTEKQAEVDGKHIAWHESTVFLVQIGRYKSAYKTRYTVTGNLSQALMYYNGLNIGNGYKKRLLVPSFNKPVVARAFS